MASERNKIIAAIVGCSETNQKRIAEVVRDATTAIGKQNLLETKKENDNKIIEWLRVKYDKKSDALPVTQNNSAPTDELSVTGNAKLNTQTQPSEALPVTQDDNDLIETANSVTSNAQQHNSMQSVEALPVTQPKKRNKVKRPERAANLTRISFGGTGNTKRYHITLEKEYIDALSQIAPNNINEWLLNTVAKYPHESESPTRIIKTQIVATLLSMIPTTSE